MKDEDVRLWMRVVPHSKTCNDGTQGLENSFEWRKAQNLEQPFLFITELPGENEDFKEYVLCATRTEGDGDFFKAVDFEPYEGTPKHCPRCGAPYVEYTWSDPSGCRNCHYSFVE